MNNSDVNVAVIPVAGLGTRWLPVTRSVPKELLPVWKRTAVSFAVEEAVLAGIEEIVFVISPGQDLVAQHFRRDTELVETLRARHKQQMLGPLPDLWDRVRVQTAEQPLPLGLGHAVLCARDIVDDRPFALLLPDEVLTVDGGATAQLVRHGGAAISLMRVPREDTSRYGIADLEDPAAAVSRVLGLVEKPGPAEAPSDMAIIGRYVLPSSIFEILETQTAGHGGEIQLTDSLARLAASQPMMGVRFDGTRHDVGNPVGLLLAAVDFALQDKDDGNRIREGLRSLLNEVTH